MNEELQAAEKRGYAKGYAAGRRRKVRDVHGQRQAAAREAFRQRAFLAALPALIETGGTWKMAGREVKTLDDRVELAWRFAAQAVKGL